MLLVMLAAATSFTNLPAIDEQDVRCLAFLSRAAQKVEGEERRRVDGGAIWYFGRLAARSPSLDPVAEVAKILASSAYDGSAYEADKQRCRMQLNGFAQAYGAWAAMYHTGASSSASSTSPASR
jgi:hypothetical protein